MRHLPAVVLVSALLTACADTPSAPSTLSPSIFDEDPQVSTATLVSAEGDFYCRGTFTGTFENVIVAEGATCTLTSATVSGNILAKDGSRLYVYETTTAGNIDGVESAILHVRAGRVDGSIQVQDGVSPGKVGVKVSGGTLLTQGNITVQKMQTGSILITDARLPKGNILLQENTVSSRLSLLRNTVAQNLQVFVNGGAGAKAVTNNHVGQTLSCKENQLPFIGRPNTAGDVEGQCGR
jgi:hypothetical protein